MDIQTAQAQHPEAFAEAERKIAEWVAALDEHPHPTPLFAEVVTEDGASMLQVVVRSDYVDLIAFRAPLNPSAVVH